MEETRMCRPWSCGRQKPDQSFLREEDECGGGGGGAYVHVVPNSREDWEKWWNDASTAIPKYPSYAVFLATESDSAVARLVEATRPDVKQMSGPKCCLIYFRVYEEAEAFRQWQFSEHARMVYPLATALGIDYSELPCLLFFRQISSGEYVRVSLRGLEGEDLHSTLRDLFGHIKNSDDPFRSVQKYKTAVRWTCAQAAVKNGLYELGRKIPDALIAVLELASKAGG
jgi:hypothetical protein